MKFGLSLRYNHLVIAMGQDADGTDYQEKYFASQTT